MSDQQDMEDIEVEIDEDIEAEIDEDIEAEIDEDIEAEIDEDIEAEIDEDIEAEIDEDIEAEIDEETVEYVEKERRGVSTYKLDVPYRLLAEMYKEGDLVINPSFQRLFRWTVKQQSAFIESLLLAIPIPQIFVAEVERGVWELIDGLQRVSTFLAFRGDLSKEKGADDEKNNFKLTDLEILQELNGTHHTELPNQLQLSIGRVPCRVEVLRSGKERNVKVDLFTRINTGGELLSKQEFRNCISRIGNDRFADMIIKMSQNKWFKKYVIMGKERREKKEDQEYVLRFLSMHDSFKDFKEEKNITLGEFLTKYVRSAISNVDYDLEEKKQVFTDTLRLVSNHVEYPFGSGKRKFTGIVCTGVLVSVSQNLKNFRDFGSEFTKEHIESVQVLHSEMARGLSKFGHRNRIITFLDAVFTDTEERIVKEEEKRSV